MSAQIVITRTNGTSGPTGNFFAGRKFWLSKALPQRSFICEQLESNGGQITALENDADVKIADHAKKHAPPGTYSFKYILDSVRKGELQDLERYAAGPPQGAVRDVASARPAKGTRRAFSAADDRILYDWVKDQERKGQRILGNEIYKQLEQMNPRHTFQSWRDRWVKHLQHRQGPRPPFTEDEFELLLDGASDIMEAGSDGLDQWWEDFAQTRTEHTASEWRKYFEEEVLPEYNRRKHLNGRDTSAAHVRSLPRSSAPLRKEQANRGTSGVKPQPRSQLVGSNSRDPTSRARAPSRSTQTEREDSLASNPHAQLESIGPAYIPEKGPGRSIIEDSYRSTKRKSGDLETDDVPKGRISEVQPVNTKRRLLSKARSKVPEIPSTPEMSGGMQPADSAKAVHPDAIGDVDEALDLDGEVDTIVRERAPSESLTEPGGADGVEAIIGTEDDPLADLLNLCVPEPEGGWSQYGVDDEQLPTAVPDEVPSDAVQNPKDFSEETLSTALVQDDIEDENSIPRSSPPILTPKPHYSNPFGVDSDTDELESSHLARLSQQQNPRADVAPGRQHESLFEPSNHPEPTTREDDTGAVTAAEEEDDSAGDLDSWIDAHVLQGYDEEVIMQALRHATMDSKLADMILKLNGKASDAPAKGPTSNAAAKGPTSDTTSVKIKLPMNVPGIWTQEDDEDLLEGSKSKVMALRKRHGDEAFWERWSFLKSYTADEEDDSSSPLRS